MSLVPDTRSVFARLFAFRQRGDRSPEEDYFSEAFASVLCRDERLAASIFHDFSGQKVTNVVVRTQQTYRQKRPDIVLEGRDKFKQTHRIFVESKFGSAEGEGQLAGYQEELKRLPARSRTLVYITKFVDEGKTNLSDSECNFVQRRWNDVYQRLRNYSSEHPHSELLTELISFMEESNMSFDLKPDEVLASVAFYNARDKYWNVLNEAWERGALKSVLDAGVWDYKSDPLVYQSPKHEKSGVALRYGIWCRTNAKDDENYAAISLAENRQWPSAFICLYHKEDPLGTYQRYRDGFDSLIKKGKWRLLINESEMRGHYIASKSYLLTDITRQDLGDEFVRFFANEFDVLSQAAFFSR